MPKRNTQTFKRAMNEYINLYLKIFLAIDSMYLGTSSSSSSSSSYYYMFFGANRTRENTHTVNNFTFIRRGQCFCSASKYASFTQFC